MRLEDLERERACFALLRSLGGRDAVLVGGYAVRAYGPPRFSVDVDLVLPGSALRGIRPILRQRGSSASRSG
ncbi:MAG: nucleotidyl transferase AbiEii/AbiGii toxin family protein [Candidatus Thermoplasmatota archaeon]